MKTLVGEKHKMLLVICDKGRDRFQNRIWECLCDCGNKKILTTTKIKSQYPISCGCHRKTCKKATSLDVVNSITYSSYSGMKTRIFNPNHINYEFYGGRGIKIAENWIGKGGFKNFLNDMGERPSKDYSLDRINNDGDYEPSNCRWATLKEQANNKSNTLFVELNGVIKPVSLWASELNINPSTIKDRINKGFPSELVLRQDKIKRKAKLNTYYEGSVLSLKEIAKKTNTSYNTLYSRLKKMESAAIR